MDPQEYHRRKQHAASDRTLPGHQCITAGQLEHLGYHTGEQISSPDITSRKIRWPAGFEPAAGAEQVIILIKMGGAVQRTKPKDQGEDPNPSAVDPSAHHFDFARALYSECVVLIGLCVVILWAYASRPYSEAACRL